MSPLLDSVARVWDTWTWRCPPVLTMSPGPQHRAPGMAENRGDECGGTAERSRGRMKLHDRQTLLPPLPRSDKSVPLSRGRAITLSPADTV